MNYSFEDYENAVLSRLAGLKEPQGYLKELQGYAGELDEETALENFLRGWPGVLVEVSRADYEVTTMPYYSQEVYVSLLVGARSFRSQAEARGGSTGAYAILADLRRLLLGDDLGLEIRPLELVGETTLGSTPNAVLYLAQYKFVNDRIAEE
jgi:hypothetical protein